MPNTCGECTECCFALAIKEMPKDEYVECRHVCADGCGVYDKRPQPCRDYECSWLREESPLITGEQWRPDNCGLIFNYNRSPAGPIMQVWETRRGSLEGEQGAALIKQLAAKIPICVMEKGKRKWMLDRKFEHLIDQLEQFSMMV